VTHSRSGSYIGVYCVGIRYRVGLLPGLDFAQQQCRQDLRFSTPGKGLPVRSSPRGTVLPDLIQHIRDESHDYTQETFEFPAGDNAQARDEERKTGRTVQSTALAAADETRVIIALPRDINSQVGHYRPIPPSSARRSTCILLTRGPVCHFTVAPCLRSFLTRAQDYGHGAYDKVATFALLIMALEASRVNTRDLSSLRLLAASTACRSRSLSEESHCAEVLETYSPSAARLNV